MKEIAGNLKRDVKDLLDESANLVTGFFKRGICTVRAVGDKWKAFARDLSDAVDTLMKPPFVDGPEAPAPALNEAAEPTVTIMESEDDRFPVGLQLPLSQADELVRNVGWERYSHNQEPNPVTVKIDYMMNGQSDCYWLPLEIGAPGDLLEQMRDHINQYLLQPDEVSALFNNVPEEHREQLRETFVPTLEESLHDLSMTVLHYLRRHCDISAMVQSSELQAKALPESRRQSFLAATQQAASTLRRAANNGEQSFSDQHQQENDVVRPDHNTQTQPIQATHAAVPANHSQQEERPKSVKLKLKELKAGQNKGTNPKRVHTAPKR